MGKYLNEFLKEGLRCAGIFLMVNIIGIGLLFLAYKIPRESVRENVESGYTFLGDYGVYRDGMDGYTDALIMSTCYIQSDKTIQAVLKNNVSRMGIEQFMAYEGLGDLLSNPEEYSPYSNYFVGSVALYKVLFYFFSYEQIRNLLVIGMVGLFVCICIKTYQKLGGSMVLALTILFLGVRMFTTVQCLTYAVDIYLMCGAVLCVYYFHNKKNYIVTLFFMIGVLTFFLNYWSWPLFSLCIPLAIHMALLIKEDDIKKSVKEFFLCAGAWIVGFGGEVALRILSAHFLSGSTSLAHLREYSTAGSFDRGYGRIESTYYCWLGYFTKENKILFYLGLLLLIIFSIRKLVQLFRKFDKNVIWISAVFAGIFFIPLVWLSILYNHTFHGFDSMLISISVFAVLAYISCLGEYGKQVCENGK